MERTQEELKAYQDKLRVDVLLRCQSQKSIAAKCKLTNIYFNYWLKRHRELGPVGIKNVELFLAE